MSSNRQTSLPFALTPERIQVAQDIVLFKYYLTAQAPAFLKIIHKIAAIVPFRHMMTPMGYPMTASMTNCGTFGWTADKTGYRYTTRDPLTEKLWPPMPSIFYEQGHKLASLAGWKDFCPNGCLINCYQNKAHMGLHRDQDEKDFTQPIVSCSFGASATFVIGRTKDYPHQRSITLDNGDVLIWGGKSRLMKHGIRRIIGQSDDPTHPPTRYNLTLRYVGKSSPTL